jgi:hypothetical protein
MLEAARPLELPLSIIFSYVYVFETTSFMRVTFLVHHDLICLYVLPVLNKCTNQEIPQYGIFSSA